jgi:hypothetical protein
MQLIGDDIVLEVNRDVTELRALTMRQTMLLGDLSGAKGLGRASQFAEGHSIEPNLAELIPDGPVGRILNRVEARRLLKLMRYGPHIPEPGDAMRGRGTK